MEVREGFILFHEHMKIILERFRQAPDECWRLLEDILLGEERILRPFAILELPWGEIERFSRFFRNN